MKAVAIDGPAGAGKSVISKAVAKALGFVHVDTGALYRVVGLFALSRGKNPADENEITPLLSEISVEMKYIDGEQRVFLCGKDVTGNIRTPEVSMAASAVSAIPAVREFLFDTQRSIALSTPVVMDGRDIGSVVLPEAEAKIFLTASPEERARRRFLELTEKGEQQSYEDVLADVIQRDYNDSHRAVSPLCVAEGATVIDTTSLSLEEAMKAVTDTAKRLLSL